MGLNAAFKTRSKRRGRFTGAMLHRIRASEETSAVMTRFMTGSGRQCMTLPHLSPDSGVADSDLCERRQKCQRENVCVRSHQLGSAASEMGRTPDHAQKPQLATGIRLR